MNDQSKAILEQRILESIRARQPEDTRYLKDHTEVQIEDDGNVLVKMPEYGKHQNYGIRPFIMHSLEGKTIPMQMGNRTIIRTVRNAGSRRISDRDPVTGRILKGNRPISWRHPGLPPKLFVELGVAEVMGDLATMKVIEAMNA